MADYHVCNLVQSQQISNHIGKIGLDAITAAELRHARLVRQMLAPGTQLDSAAGLVRQLFAVQSQEWASAQLAIAARTQRLTQADVRQARETERSFILTWALRGTLHLVAAEDARWLTALCGPGAIRSTRRRYQQLGLSADVRERALGEIETILRREGALTRPQLAEALGERGIPVAGQAIHHLVRFAALRGLLCLGAEVDGDLTYALLDEWLPAAKAAPPPDKPLAEFARRYLAAYGPATKTDFRRWSGLSAAQVKAAWAEIERDCAPVALPAGAGLMLERQLPLLALAADEPTARLLPRYDNYLLGYASRAFMVADEQAKRLHPGGGLIRACVIVAGQALANWKLEKRRAGIRISVTPFESLEAPMLPPLEREAEALGKFLNARAELRIKSP